MSGSGLRIIVPGASFTRNVGQVSYPVVAGLDALFYLGNSEALTIANRATARPNGVMSRAPQAYFDGYVRFGGLLSYLQTQALDTVNDLTLISVVRSVAGPAPIISNYDTTAGSTELLLSGSGMIGGVFSNVTLPGNVYTSVATAGRFVFAATIVSGASISVTVSGWDGALHTTVSDEPFERVQNIGVPFRIGARYGDDVPGVVQDIAVAAIHSSALTADQLDVVYRYLRSRLAKQGIAI